MSITSVRASDVETQVYDRRGRRRSDFEGGVRVQVGGQPVKGRAADLSTGGIGLFVDERLEVGSDVTVEFEIPGADVLVVDAAVSWCAGGRAGLRFTRLNPVSLGRIMACLAA